MPDTWKLKANSLTGQLFCAIFVKKATTGVDAKQYRVSVPTKITNKVERCIFNIICVVVTLQRKDIFTELSLVTLTITLFSLYSSEFYHHCWRTEEPVLIRFCDLRNLVLEALWIESSPIFRILKLITNKPKRVYNLL